MEKVIEVIAICDEGGNEQLRIPSSLKASFQKILQPYTDADAADDHGGLAPFIGIDDFKDFVRSDEEITDAMNEVSQSADDHDRILAVAWSILPNWAKSVSAFEKRWKLRIGEPSLYVSHGYLRGHMPSVFGP